MKFYPKEFSYHSIKILFLSLSRKERERRIQVNCQFVRSKWKGLGMLGSPGGACVSRTQSILSSAACLRIPLVSRSFADWLEAPGARAVVPGLQQRSLAPIYKRNHFIPLTITANLLGRALTIATAVDPLSTSGTDAEPS